MIKVLECLHSGICIVKFEGRVTLGEASELVTKYFERRLTGGLRFFVVSFSDIAHVDSSGLGAIMAAIVRVRMRSGRVIFTSLGALDPVLQVTKLRPAVDVAPNLTAAFKLILGKPVEVLPELQYVELYSLRYEQKNGEWKLVEHDRLVEPPKTAEYPIRDIPSPSPDRLTITGMAGVAFVGLVILALLFLGLVWITKEISSVPLLVLIFSMALLISLCLVAFMLLLSGHLSEKMTGRLLTGVLSKVPGLSIWVPKVLARKAKSRGAA